MDSAQKTKHTWRQNLCMCLICTDNTNCVCLLTRIGTDSGQNRPRISVQAAVQLAHWFFACSVYSCPTGTLVFRLLCIQLSNWHIDILFALYNYIHSSVQLAHWYCICFSTVVTWLWYHPAELISMDCFEASTARSLSILCINNHQ